LVLFGFGISFTHGQNVRAGFNEVYILKSITSMVDTSNQLEIQDVQNKNFELLPDNGHSGVFNQYNHWFKLDISNFESGDTDLALLIDQANLDSIEVYQKNQQGIWEKQFLGKNYPFSERPYLTNHFIVKVKVGNSNIIYVKVNSQVQTSFNFIVGEIGEVLNYENIFTLCFVLILGVFLAMIGYNTFLYLSIREPVYLIYVIQSILTGILQIVLFGLSMQFLWPNHMWYQEFSMVVFTSVSTMTGLVFMIAFLRTNKYTPTLHKISIYIIGVYGLLTFYAWFNSVLVHEILLAAQPLIAIFILTVAILVIIRGYKPARFYLLAWSSFLIGILIYVLAEVGIIERNMFTILAIPFGSAMEVVLLSFALANRINILKASQDAAIAKSYQLEKENAQYAQKQNIILEQKVAERTTQLKSSNLKLEEKNHEIEKAYTDLKNAQSQLVTAEKMSSLGQLTAGIAHEINNPINFVSANVAPLRRDVDDVILLVTQIEELVKEKFTEEEYKAIQELKSSLDYDFVIEEINQLLDGMSDGAHRTVEIIKGLKLFSRVDEDDLKKVNLEDGINATLVLLNSVIKHEIKIEKSFAGIPNVECFGGKMNQVFMNILSNAIHAVKMNKDQESVIKIETLTGDGQVTIRIADNGPGMTEDTKNKLFEPFFTTKPVGEGTGLGLSIVYKIVDKINGTIEVNSVINKGTEFIITLPINNTTKPPNND
tara:strand:+ start:44948 stop:47086 length:2139 start_codon:yes stop_codon:yes gene_type:complete